MHFQQIPLLICCFFFCISCQVEEFIIEDYTQENDKEVFQMTPIIRMADWTRMQGGSIFNDLLVCMTAADWGETPNGFIYDLNTEEKVCSMTFTSTLGQICFYMPHANQISFGQFYLNEESDFPLLYVSQVNGGNGINDIRGERGVLVYDLERAGNNLYIPKLVQVIIPELSDDELMNKIGRYTPNYVVDTDKNQFIIIGYPNNSWYDLSGPQPIAILPIPSIKDGEVFVFNNTDIIDSFTLPETIGPQQSFYYKGKVYSSGGDAGQASLRVIDLEKKSVVFFRDLTDITKGEPQFLGLWHEKILYYEYGISGQLYEIIIPGFNINSNTQINDN